MRRGSIGSGQPAGMIRKQKKAHRGVSNLKSNTEAARPDSPYTEDGESDADEDDEDEDDDDAADDDGEYEDGPGESGARTIPVMQRYNEQGKLVTMAKNKDGSMRIHKYDDNMVAEYEFREQAVAEMLQWNRDAAKRAAKQGKKVTAFKTIEQQMK